MTLHTLNYNRQLFPSDRPAIYSPLWSREKVKLKLLFSKFSFFGALHSQINLGYEKKNDKMSKLRL